MSDDKKEFKPDGKYHPKLGMLKRAKLRLKMAKKKKMNESDLFNSVKVGDVVHYSTPQGQYGKGKVVIHGGEHVVVNRGKGQPQVVNDRNYVKHERGGKVVGALLSRLSQVKEATWQGAGDPYNWDPVMRQQVFAAAAKKNREQQKAKGQPVPHELDTGRALKSKPAPFRRGVKEDSHDMGGAAERVAKTKKHKKKLHELNTGTLASYVSKAIADRKKQQGMADMAQRIHTPERAKYFVDKAAHKAAQRSKGIKTAVGKIAGNLPAEPLKAHSDSESAKHGGWSGMEAREVNEVSAPGKESWIKANKQRFIARYGKEKGLRVLYAKAWKDSKATNEARESEYGANIQMAQSAGKVAKTEKGHYLMRDGRRLSGPHSPEAAVKAYKGMSDSKGVKIVHVKETHTFDVTAELISESKVKEAAQKAISLAKKAKGNKHVDTEPKLDIQDKGGGGPMGGTHEDPEGSVNAKL